MSAQILDGKVLAKQMIEALKLKITTFNKKPVLYAVHLMQDPSIESYVLSQQKTAQTIGIEYKRIDATGQSQDEIIKVLNGLLQDPLAAIFIFKPTPQHIDFNYINEQIRDLRNIEGVYPLNLGLFFLNNKNAINPPTPLAAMHLLKSCGIALSGKTAVVLGRSETVGKPLMHLLMAENVTVSVCHSKTPMDRLITLVQSADIVCACVGIPHFVKKEWIKPGAIVIDIGINQLDGKIVGDVMPDVKDIASFMSPVPGGVGPVTSACLMQNVVAITERKA